MTAAPPAPHAPDVLLRAAAAVFSGLSRARHGRRSLHPRGSAFAARVELDPPPGVGGGARLFSAPGSYAATVRFSRGFGFPQPWPDLLGVAIRLHDAYGPGEDQDLLFTSSAAAPVLRRVLLPARDGFFGQAFSSVLPFRVGDRRTVMGAWATAEPVGASGRDLERLAATARTGTLTFALALAAGPLRGWRTVGELRIGERLAPEASEALSFAAWTTAPDIVPVGLLNTLRAAAYPGSRRGRRAAGQRTGPAA
jgi:hypothetical protein